MRRAAVGAPISMPSCALLSETRILCIETRQSRGNEFTYDDVALPMGRSMTSNHIGMDTDDRDDSDHHLIAIAEPAPSVTRFSALTATSIGAPGWEKPLPP